MADITGTETEFSGSHGRARLIPLPGIPAAAETVCTWLVTAPHAHPMWSQYMLGCVRLRDGIPGFPPPVRLFDGATHEINVVALNPEHGPFTVEDMRRFQLDGGMPYLTPVNIAHQVEGSDDEALKLTVLAARAIVHGHLWPEVADAPDRVRAAWDTSLIKTLAHLRGEEHAP